MNIMNILFKSSLIGWCVGFRSLIGRKDTLGLKPLLTTESDLK